MADGPVPDDCRPGDQVSLSRAHLDWPPALPRCPLTDPATWLRLVFDDVHQTLARHAAETHDNVADYATTLAVALLTNDGVAVGQVGDTIVVIATPGQYWTLAPAPRYRYVNETVFVTHSDAPDHLRVTVTPAATVDAVFLATDGLRLKILDDLAGPTPFAPFFDDVAAYVRTRDADSAAVHRFLGGVNDQSGDDKSLVVAVRREP